jgi:hypothetical protein
VALSSHEDKIETQAIAIAQLLGKIDLIAQDQARTLAAVTQIETAKSRASPKQVRQMSFLDGIVPSWTGDGCDSAVAMPQNDPKRRVTEELLRELSYPAINDREKAIAKAHEETFKWILSNRSPLTQSIVDWLRSGHGVYWINGKAGSGKSTLMKYIFEQPEFCSLLKEWAGGDDLITARFYLWSSGTPEQRSQMGLLRSLLHEIIKHDPTLAPLLFPVRWAAIYSRISEPFAYNSVGASSSWELPELTYGFKKLVHQDTKHKKFCLLIDGLDEYDGDHHYIASLFQDISASTGIKICLSSRPLLAFQDAFGSSPSLRLQDLTYEDIKGYVIASFSVNRYFCALKGDDPNTASELIESVLQRADGVFLWVRLVVASLLEGLGNRDTIEDLKERLLQLPDDLSDLYDNMLKSIPLRCQERAAKVFDLIEASHSVMDRWEGEPHEIKQLDTFTLELALRVPSNSVFDLKQVTADRNERSRACQQMEDQLKVCCAGLVETGSLGKVGYIHQSVRDYLQLTRNGTERSINVIGGYEWDPHAAMLESFVLQCCSGGTAPQDFFTFAHTALLHARYYSGQNPARYMETVRILGEEFVRHLKDSTDIQPVWIGHSGYITKLLLFQEGYMTHYMDSIAPHLDRVTLWRVGNLEVPRHPAHMFPLIATKWNLVEYVDNYLKTLQLESNSFKDDLDMFCYLALRFPWNRHRYGEGINTLAFPEGFMVCTANMPPRPDMVAILLRYGLNPNRHVPLSDRSPWLELLGRLAAPSRFQGLPPEWYEVLVEALTHMLDHGASLNYSILRNGKCIPVRAAITHNVRQWNSEYAEKLDELFEKYGGKTTLSLLDRWKVWRRIRMVIDEPA